MPTIQIMLTDAEAATIKQATGFDAAVYLKGQAKTLVESCKNRCREQALEKVGIRSLSDLTQAQIDAITG